MILESLFTMLILTRQIGQKYTLEYTVVENYARICMYKKYHTTPVYTRAQKPHKDPKEVHHTSFQSVTPP